MSLSGDAPITITREAAREAAKRELSKPIYHKDDPSLLQRGLDWFWNKISELFDTASGATPGHAVGLIVILLLVVMVLVALRLRLGRIRTATGGGPALFGDRPLTAAEHRAAAERHAGQGEWAEAVQERMRALVRSLEERTVLDPRPGRTADEAAAEAGRTLPDHAARLRDAARSFDDVTYGGRPATRDAYTALRNLDTELQRAKPVFSDTDVAPAGGARA
jgi:hypothetical protein